MSENYVALNIQIPTPLAQAIADYKALTGVSITAFVRKAIEDRLKRAIVDEEPASKPATQYRPPVRSSVLTAPNPPRVVGKVSE
jgi:hypothetical protein